MRAEVPIAPLRDAFLASGLTAYEVGRRLGWLRSPGVKADTSRVQRALGIRPWPSGNGYQTVIESTSYERALQLAEAIGIDPVDLGL